MAEVQCKPMPAIDESGWTEWTHPLPGYLMQCCDCGLVHEMEFSVERIVERRSDGTFFTEEAGTDELIVMFRARRHEVTK